MADAASRRPRFGLGPLLIVPTVFAAALALNTRVTFPNAPQETTIVNGFSELFFDVQEYGWPWTCVTFFPAPTATLTIQFDEPTSYRPEVKPLSLLGNIAVPFLISAACCWICRKLSR